MKIYYVIGLFGYECSRTSAYVFANCKEDAIRFYKKRFASGIERNVTVSAYEDAEVCEGLIIGSDTFFYDL